jgi:hypothetical protein
VAEAEADNGAKGAPHVSVLLEEVLAYLNVRPGGRYLDGTFGAGGYSRAILQAAAWGAAGRDPGKGIRPETPGERQLCFIKFGCNHFLGWIRFVWICAGPAGPRHPDCRLTAIDQDPHVQPFVEALHRDFGDRFEFRKTNFASSVEAVAGPPGDGHLFCLLGIKRNGNK